MQILEPCHFWGGPADKLSFLIWGCPGLVCVPFVDLPESPLSIAPDVDIPQVALRFETARYGRRALPGPDTYAAYDFLGMEENA